MDRTALILGIEERIRNLDEVQKGILIGTEESSIIQFSYHRENMHRVSVAQIFEEREFVRILNKKSHNACVTKIRTSASIDDEVRVGHVNNNVANTCVKIVFYFLSKECA